MLATEHARITVTPNKMGSSINNRAFNNGSTPSFSSSNMASSSSRFPSSSTMRSSNESEQGFLPPLPTTFSSPPPPPDPPSDVNIMNRRAGADSSLYQICMNLRRRLAEVPNFEDHLAEMEEDEAENNDTLDPVSLMWNCLRRGYPLMTIYNALRPREPLDVDSNRVKKSQVGKAATFKFLQACMETLKIPAADCFLITDLYGEDTTGFVKVRNHRLLFICSRTLRLGCLRDWHSERTPFVIDCIQLTLISGHKACEPGFGYLEE